jgi:tetratricopeptide (TPR) repeat protein
MASDLFRQADRYDESRDFEGAIEWYMKVLEGRRDDPRVLARIGRCHYEMSDYSEAVNWFGKALDIRPDAPSTLFMRARCFEELGDLDRALADYRRSADLSPRADALINIALIYKYRKELRLASDALSRALELDSRNLVAIDLLKSLR